MRPNTTQRRDMYSSSYVFTDWTVTRVRTALRDLSAGQFDMSAQLVDAMLRDDRIGGTLRTRVRGLLGLPFRVEPADDRRKSKIVASSLLEDWTDILPAKSLMPLMRWTIMLGVGVAELVWERPAVGRWIPRVKVWHPRWLRWNDQTREFNIMTQEGMIPVRPGQDNWVLLSLAQERPWMEGLIGELAIPYLIRQFGARDWARYSEVHGQPTKLARVPAGVTDEKDIDRFFDSINELGAEATVKMRSYPGTEAQFGYDLLEAKSESWRGFEALRKNMDSSIAISVLGQNLSTEVGGGSLAAAKVHDQVRQDVLEADANVIREEVKAQIITPWMQSNFTDAGTAPEAIYDATPPADKKLRADTLTALSAALEKLDALGINTDPILEEFELERKIEAVPVIDPKAALKGTFSKSGLPQQLTAADDAFKDGQTYADTLAVKGKSRGADALEPDLQAIIEAINGATSLEDVKTAILGEYENMDATQLEAIIKNVLVLGKLAGMYAVQLETAGED